MRVGLGPIGSSSSIGLSVGGLGFGASEAFSIQGLFGKGSVRNYVVGIFCMESATSWRSTPSQR